MPNRTLRHGESKKIEFEIIYILALQNDDSTENDASKILSFNHMKYRHITSPKL